MKIHTIFFDWYHTLSNDNFWGHIKNNNPKLYQEITNKVFNNPDISVKEWMRGFISTNEIIKKISNDDKEFNFLKNELIHSVKNTKFANKDIIVLLNKLKQKGIKLVIATDNMDVFMDYTVPSLNLYNYFDNIICSSDINCLKIDLFSEKPRFFEDYLSKNNINYKDCLFIDDQKKFIDFYKKYGMNTERIENTDDIENIVRKYIML